MAETINDDQLIKGLNEFGSLVVLNIALLLRQLDKSASNKLIQSLNHDLVTVVKGINYRIEIYGEDYFTFVDKGRKQGKQPPLRKIEKWVTLKGLEKKSAFPIARKIGRFGIPPTNIIKQMLQKLNTNSIKNKIDDAFIKMIDQQIKEEYNKYK